ncbi:MAG: hypothetical protein ACLGHN_05780 [Bacteriovoracia bacterium]
MESAEIVEWAGDSRARFIERAIELETWGDYEGHPNLGKRLISEVDSKIQEIKGNLNLYSVRENEERVVPLSASNHILIYKKIYRPGLSPDKKTIQLLILDVRRFY